MDKVAVAAMGDRAGAGIIRTGKIEFPLAAKQRQVLPRR